MRKKPERTVTHRRFGEIPLVCVSYRTPDGKEGSYWTYDLTYKPPLPKGAVAGNPARQNYCTGCNVPKYFFVDEERRCVECEETFTFGAKEQKFWYEDLHFNAHSEAIRCLDCRKARRDAVVLQKAHAAAVRLARSKPVDPCALLAMAESAIEYHLATGQGNLARALAAVRKARTLDPALLESLYWEGVVQEAAGRPEKAQESLDRFIAAARPFGRYKVLVKRAQKRLHRP